jgi:hypothetical protein
MARGDRHPSHHQPVANQTPVLNHSVANQMPVWIRKPVDASLPAGTISAATQNRADRNPWGSHHVILNHVSPYKVAWKMPALRKLADS